MRFSTEKSRDCLTRDNDTLSECENVHRRQCHCRTCVLCRSHTAFDDVLLLLLVAVVLAEINQKETVHLLLVSVFSIRRPGVGRISHLVGTVGGLPQKCFVAMSGLEKSAMSESLVTLRSTAVVFLHSAEMFQEKTTAFSFSRASRALSKAVGNPATGKNLPCWEISLARERERERDGNADTDTDRQTQTCVLFI